MRKLKVLAFAALALVTLRSSSCGKQSNPTNMGSWHLSGHAFTAKSIYRAGTSVTGTAADGLNTATVFVNGVPNSAPDAGTTYKIVGYDKMNQLANDECIVQVATSATDMYVSTANNSGTMNLRINNDLVTISVPSIWATHYVSYSAQADSAKIDVMLSQ